MCINEHKAQIRKNKKEILNLRAARKHVVATKDQARTRLEVKFF